MSILKSKWSYWLLIVLVTSLIVNLSRSLIRIWQSQAHLKKAEEALIEAQKENQELKQQKALLQTQDFIEEEARNKLFMAKEGEMVVLLPEEIEFLQDEARPVIKVEDLAVWRQWLELFL